MILRCANCGAPLAGTQGVFVITCPYCSVESRLVTEQAQALQERSARLTQASREVRDMVAANAALQQRLDAKAKRLLNDALLTKDPATARACLQAFEGATRLTYAPSIHFYNALGPEDPIRIKALAEIDEVVDKVVAAIAKTLEIDYVPAARRG